MNYIVKSCTRKGAYINKSYKITVHVFYVCIAQPFDLPSRKKKNEKMKNNPVI